MYFAKKQIYVNPEETAAIIQLFDGEDCGTIVRLLLARVFSSLLLLSSSPLFFFC